MPIRILTILAKPWVIAAGGGVAAYLLYRKNRDTKGRLRDAKLELIEQQHTIDRLRAEVGRERHRRQDGDRPY